MSRTITTRIIPKVKLTRKPRLVIFIDGEKEINKFWNELGNLLYNDTTINLAIADDESDINVKEFLEGETDFIRLLRRKVRLKLNLWDRAKKKMKKKLR